ncbi:hypothetical protein L9F63_021048 [Diploptera punctata]|uniref:Uncharacterized protein n=1 Tax=Diploptera punctata TaxID=6984 RepID=A0AAD8EC48_DIPPU|nr:hypothetical protein L9F63_021048 [Diploptera punctata]
METSVTNEKSTSRENSVTETKRASFRDSVNHERDATQRGSVVEHPDGTPRIPRKFITNWRQACDRTKDRTKELLKRWRTLPESEIANAAAVARAQHDKEHGWSVHVWVPRLEPFAQEADLWEDHSKDGKRPCLSQLQKEKFGHFFSHLLDWDKDELISDQDFEALSENLFRRWNWEFHVLREVQQGFIEQFINTTPEDPHIPRTASLEHWLMQWNKLVAAARNLHDFPLWLQYFSKIIFLVINKSEKEMQGDELRVFYSSFLGFSTPRVGEVLDIAYSNMTSNGDHPLRYHIYHLCFANFLLGRHPHGPGEFLFGPFEGTTSYSAMFPIDYSALSSPPQALEPYSPNKKTNRRSVVV